MLALNLYCIGETDSLDRHRSVHAERVIILLRTEKYIHGASIGKERNLF